MRWTRWASVATLALIGQAAGADVVVVRANGPSAARFAPGKTLADKAQVTLQRGDQIVLLDAHGTRTLSGPGIFIAAGGSSGPAPAAFTAMATTSVSRRARVGAVRGTPGADEAMMRPGIFLVDTAVAGKVCIVDPASVTLWRGDTRAAATSTLTGGDGRSATVDWIAGQATSPWPSALPVAQGATYKLRLSTAAPTDVAIQFQMLAAAPSDLPQLASGLIAHGCQGQVDVLIATTRATPGAGG